MASIRKFIQKDGTVSFTADVRINKTSFKKSFSIEEDAKLYAFYKERLIKNMEAFDVPLKNRVTLRQVYELRMKNGNFQDSRTKNSFMGSFNKISDYIDPDRFLSDIPLEEWIGASKKLYSSDVFMGAKTENGKRRMSLATLRNIFAYISSMISHAQSEGLDIENNALKVMQMYITPMIKEEKSTSQP